LAILISSESTRRTNACNLKAKKCLKTPVNTYYSILSIDHSQPSPTQFSKVLNLDSESRRPGCLLCGDSHNTYLVHFPYIPFLGPAGPPEGAQRLEGAAASCQGLAAGTHAGAHRDLPHGTYLDSVARAGVGVGVRILGAEVGRDSDSST
jgi:hypothetical protein